MIIIYSKQKGFTLIEIMVALFIGLFLAAGAANIFINTNTSNRLQENLSRMQENARFAMHFLREDIQQAGFLGGDCLSSIAPQNKLKLLLSPPYTASHHSFTTDSLSGAVNGVNGAPNHPDGSGLDNADEISLRAFFSLNPQSTSTSMASRSVNVQAKTGSGFRENDIVLITDCKHANIFQITNDPGSNGDQLEHAIDNEGADTADLIPGNIDGNLSKPYGKDSRLYVLSNGSTNNLTRGYRIDDSTSENIPSLFRNSAALIGDIENMQIVYGVNTDPESPIGLYNTPNYYTANIAALSASELEQIKAVRISLLLRSPDDNLVSPKQAYFFNGVDVSGSDIPDNRIRKVYTTTIKLRNRENYFP